MSRPTIAFTDCTVIVVTADAVDAIVAATKLTIMQLKQMIMIKTRKQWWNPMSTYFDEYQ